MMISPSKRFDGLDDLARRQLDLHDQMVINAYRAFANFDAWNGWLKIWLASKLYGDIWLMRTCMKYMSTATARCLDQLDLSTPPFAERFQTLVDMSSARSGRRRSGADTLGRKRATRCWMRSKTATGCRINAYAWGKADVHHGDFTPAYRMPLVILWGKLRVAGVGAQELFDFPPMPLVKMQMMEKMEMMRPHLSGHEAQTVAVGSAQ